MNRKEFMRLMAAGSAGVLLPKMAIANQASEDKPVIWPLIGRLILTTAVTHTVGKVLDYVWNELTEEERPEPQVIINQYQHQHFSPVYEYAPNDNDYIFARRQPQNVNPDRTYFFSKNRSRKNLRQKCADLRKPELGGLVHFTEFYQNELEQGNSSIRELLLPRTASTRDYNVAISGRAGSCVYNTQHGKIAIRYTPDDVNDSFLVNVDFSASRAMTHTSDSRYRNRSKSWEIRLDS